MRQLTDALVDQVTLRVEKKRGGQRGLTELRASLPFWIEQYVAQCKVATCEETLDFFGRLSLVQEDEVQFRVVGLGALQRRHLSLARRTPCGPQIDHGRLTFEGRE